MSNTKEELKGKKRDAYIPVQMLIDVKKFSKHSTQRLKMDMKKKKKNSVAVKYAQETKCEGTMMKYKFHLMWF
jgi:hypothetical protein